MCSSAAATAAAYQQVITTYGLHAFDFDLEEPEIENSTAIAYELGAAQILQREDPGLFISITMPSTTTGANYFGQLLLNEAKSLGFTPNDYTIMPFDGGSDADDFVRFGGLLCGGLGREPDLRFGRHGVVRGRHVDREPVDL